MESEIIPLNGKLPNVAFRKLVSFLKEIRKGNAEKIYEDREIKEINWNCYTESQVNEAKETLLFIKEEVNKAQYLVIEGKPGKPLTDPKVLAKAVLICEALGLKERKAQGWLEILGPFVGINEKLDDRTIGEAYDKLEVLHIIHQVFENTKSSDRKLCGDGTGLETSRKQNYESTKNKKEGNYLTDVIDTREIVQVFDISGTQECQIMHELVEQVDGDSLRLDAAFNDRDLVKKIAELNMVPYIYPKTINKLNGQEDWKFMYLEFYYDVIAWLEEYYQRVHCESFHSSFKRVFGTITKRRFSCKLTQVTARIILHNRARLSYFNRLKY